MTGIKPPNRVQWRAVNELFPAIRFKGQLRPSQVDVVEIARKQLAEGHRRIHVVAPPGSGKTVLGLYLWAECIQVPALVLSPNSAIQAQWADRLSLFDGPSADSYASTDSKSPKLFTSLTYQSVTLPHRGGSDVEAEAIELWIEKLVEKDQAKDPDEALVWIEDLKRHNRDYYDDRLSGYRKAVRDELAIGGEAMKTLHASALDTLERLKHAGIGLLILDECHHLLSHWGRVLADAHRYFDHPIVVGLTATPPDMRGTPPEDVARYEEFFGPIDYEVPVPAVVKDGFLAPYQDLVQIVRPTPDELAYVANADKDLYDLVEELCQSPDADPLVQEVREPLTEWAVRLLAERRLASGSAKDWETFKKLEPNLAWAVPQFLTSRGVPLPDGVPEPPPTGAATRSRTGDSANAAGEMPHMSVLIPLLDRYIRRELRTSSRPADHELAERAIRRLRMLGTQITETGVQPCASPIGRVLAYARGKARAVIPILKAEHRALGERIRAVIVTDYEKTSAVTSEVRHLLDEEAGGAIAAFRVLLSDPETDALDPILVTGSTVLVDDDLAQEFDAAAAKWLAERNLKVELDYGVQDGFHVLSGHGGDWCPRVYVAMVTELFQRGLTKCLVGTRGLLGEGWDANKINVLIDLTTVTTSTSINQLRGRSLRLDPDDPQKLAHNWDVVCIAPEFVKGLDDYGRFIKRHKTLFGITDDGVIQNGVGHVHAAFTEIEPELVEESMNILNAEMLGRPAQRANFRRLWRIGEPFNAEPVHALELLPGGCGEIPPPGAEPIWTTRSLTQAVGRAVLDALREAGLITSTGSVNVEGRAGGYVRAFLESAGEDESRLFSESLEEAMGSLDRPRYVIRRFVDYRIDSWLSRILPDLLGRYFQKHDRQMVMLHAVPSALSKNKRLAAMYSRHWNVHVSPGQPVYARSSEGEKLVENSVRKGVTPQMPMHRKTVFL